MPRSVGAAAEAFLATVSCDGCSRIGSHRKGCDGGRANAPCPCFTSKLILPCLQACRRVPHCAALALLAMHTNATTATTLAVLNRSALVTQNPFDFVASS